MCVGERLSGPPECRTERTMWVTQPHGFVQDCWEGQALGRCDFWVKKTPVPHPQAAQWLGGRTCGSHHGA